MIPIQDVVVLGFGFWVLVECGLANFNACLAHDGDNAITILIQSKD